MNSSADFEGLAEVWLPQSPDHPVAANVSFDPDRGVAIRLSGGPAPLPTDGPRRDSPPAPTGELDAGL